MIFEKSGGAVDWLIVGLGNPGQKYEHTRHNMGFLTVDLLAEQLNVKLNKVKFKSAYNIVRFGGQKCLVMKPQTYMNLSGESIRSVIDYYKVDPEKELIVIYDDISLEVGQLRIRRKGSAGGHNGIKNIIAMTGTQNFMRIKVGVGEKPKGWDLADYVLGHFSTEDRAKVEEAIGHAMDAAVLMMQGEVDKAMNDYNSKNK